MSEITHVDARLERTAIMLCCAFDNCALPQILDADDFHDQTHCKIFQAIQKNFSEKGNCSWVDLCGQFDPLLLMQMTHMDQIYWPSPEEGVAKMLREFRIRRIVEKFSVTIAEAKDMIGQLSDHTKKLTELLPSVKRDTLDVFNELFSTTAPWIPTGFPSLDHYVQMQTGNLVTIGARTRHGKSSFMINMAVHAMKRGERVDYLTKEMKDVELLPRMIECLTGKKFVHAKENVDTEIISRVNIHKIISIQDVASIAAKTDAKLIFVDYIQIISAGREFENNNSRIETIMASLKEIAMVNDKCIVTASQINRTIDNGERDLRLSDLSGSSSIENDSNIVLLLFNNAAEAKNTKSVGRMGAGAVARNLDGTGDDVIITIEKNRLGTGGRCVLKWESDVCRFIDPTKPAIDSPIPALSF